RVEVLSDGCVNCGPWLRAQRELERARRAIAATLRAGMTDERAAALAVALLTGSRGGLEFADRDTIRKAGLAHILAISGLHLSLVAGGVFWLVRAVLALSPFAALRWPLRRIAAGAAFAAGAGYLALSGNSVATQRAFVMLCVVVLAVLLARPAISMRNLALAALVILLLSPHEVVNAGFQMSFLAVLGLIAAYEAMRWRRRNVERPPPGVTRRVALYVGGLVLSTLIASAMTALPVAAHFQRLAPWGVLGNLVALPVLAFVVMPAGLLALLFMPLGLAAPFLWPLEHGLRLIFEFSGRVAALPGAERLVMKPAGVAVGLMAAGLIWLALRRDGWRLAGLGLIGIGLLWPPAPRFDVLADGRADVVAVGDEHGRLAATPGRRGAFALGQWLRHDADAASPRAARARGGWRCGGGVCRFASGRGEVVALSRNLEKKLVEKGYDNSWMKRKLNAACKDAAVVVAAFPLRGACASARVVIDRFDLWRDGAHGVRFEADGISVETARGGQGARPWALPPLPRSRVLKRKPPAANMSPPAARP
ncbi:MAG TPA: ComEC/Rec2 family competence protein, partial [Thermopetrobacter sp.]|nr:ComEC/Rec2 family competence protein [Thermopetrobacter sp.]